MTELVKMRRICKGKRKKGKGEGRQSREKKAGREKAE